MTTTAIGTGRAQIAEAHRTPHRFVIASHLRPDGDAIGSQMAMAFALRHLGKDVRVVSRDKPPAPMLVFPGVSSIDIVEQVDDPGDAVVVMECGDLKRTGVEGLDRGFVINIDHHPGNTMYGALNWFDLSAAACGEMVFDLIQALGVPL
jgi:phosphoesterase RecJ-like protein